MKNLTIYSICIFIICALNLNAKSFELGFLPNLNSKTTSKQFEEMLKKDSIVYTWEKDYDGGGGKFIKIVNSKFSLNNFEIKDIRLDFKKGILDWIGLEFAEWRQHLEYADSLESWCNCKSKIGPYNQYIFDNLTISVPSDDEGSALVGHFMIFFEKKKCKGE